jgi:hypothetical protein
VRKCGVVIFMVANIFIAVSCSGLPDSTRTGSVKTIVIEESLPDAQVSVQRGDEVRWVNQRDGSVEITFLDPLEGKVNCRRGFGLLDIINATTLKPQKSVSLCFSEPGSLRYTLRLDRALPTGQLHIPGTIAVQGSDSDS